MNLHEYQAKILLKVNLLIPYKRQTQVLPGSPTSNVG